jgi:tRNA pseudouridine38-40 synthase
MMRYAIHLAYNGKNYHGWQVQPNAKSIQGELQEKLKILTKTSIEIVGCGRTDTGVHAKNYFAHFDAEHDLDPEKLKFQLNAILPFDLSIFEIIQVDPSFHARFDAIERAYEYVICTKPNPFLVDFSLLYTKTLDIDKMNEAANLLLHHTDFECFSKVQTDVKTFNCKVIAAKWVQTETQQLIFTIKADRFLRNMVRAIVGTLLEVGGDKKNILDFRAILESKDRGEAGQSVAAKGLFLTEVHYPNQPSPNIL